MAMAEGPASEGHLLGTSPQSKDLHIVTHLDVHVLEPKGRRANGHGPKGQGFMVGKLVGKKNRTEIISAFQPDYALTYANRLKKHLIATY
jgi:hypothetical protein